MTRHLIGLALMTCTVASHAQQTPVVSPDAALARAVAAFENARFAQSVAAFDEVIALAPNYRPQLWQRGIALYYAGRYDECRAQFELHRTVNPDDVENAAWHFLCVARASSPQKAKEALLPVGPDARRPMTEIYELFRGRTTESAVLASAGGDSRAQFYARLYVGLYAEALGQKKAALDQISEAAADRYAAVGGYMHMVARVHLSVLRRQN